MNSPIANQPPNDRHTSRIEINWLRIFVEGTAIVVSILLAFWIDAWWATSQEREREMIVLKALLEEFQVLRQQVDTERRYNEAILGATTKLLEVSTGGDHDLDPAGLDRLIGDTVWYNASSRWQSATMELLVSGGDLANLSDAELVLELAPLHNRLEGARSRYRLDEAFYRDELVPFLRSQANLPQILVGIDHAPGVPEWTYDFPDINIAEPEDHTPLLSNREFRGLLAAKIDLQHDILNYSLDDLDEDLDEVILMLKSNLGE